MTLDEFLNDIRAEISASCVRMRNRTPELAKIIDKMEKSLNEEVVGPQRAAIETIYFDEGVSAREAAISILRITARSLRNFSQ